MTFSFDSFSWEVVITLIGVAIVFIWRASAERVKIEGHIDMIRGDINTIRAEITELKSNQHSLDKEHDETQQWRQQMTERVDAHDRRLGNIDARHKEIYSKMDAGFASLGDKVDKVVSDNHNANLQMTSKLGNIEGRLEQLGKHSKES